MAPEIALDTDSLKPGRSEGAASPDRTDPPVRSRSPQRLRRRAEFLSVAGGVRAAAKTLVLQARARPGKAVRFGFTVSKKVGNAVERNRVRRRLREMVRLCAAGCVPAGHDYVVVGRRAALEVPFARLEADFKNVLSRIDRGQVGEPGRKPATIGNQFGSKPGNPGSMASKR
jgi:ribonuclease P protein component